MNLGFLQRLGLCAALLTGYSGTAPAQEALPLVPAGVPKPLNPPPITQRFSIRSKILGETRHLDLALPASFSRSAANRKYPVVVVFDGEYLTGTVHTVATELARKGLIPECVVVGIENLDDYEGRVNDLTPPGLSVSGSGMDSRGDRFLDFIEQEVLPSLAATFKSGAPCVLLGHSSGAVLATFAAASRPRFHFAVSIDAPIHLDENWLARRLLDRTKKPGVAVRYAAFGARFGWPEALWGALAASAPKDWRLHYQKLQHETHNSVPMLGAYLGLREVFADYAGYAAPQVPATKTLPYYDGLTPLYGAPQPAPATVMHDTIWEFMTQGRGKLAHDVYNQYVAAYGPPADADELLPEIARIEKLPPPAETVEGLLATPFPTPEQVQDLLGAWRGESTVGRGRPSPFRLFLEVKNGAVAGRVVMHPAPGVELVMPLEYLKVDGEGFTYGYMNGMHPHALLLFPCVKVGDHYEGVQGWGGATVTMPDGRKPPEHRFTLRKANAALEAQAPIP